MAVNKTQLPLLQWRGGKRASGPSSPSVEHRSEERVDQLDGGSVVDRPSAVSQDSPSFGVKMQSPAWEMPESMSANAEFVRKTEDMTNLSTSRYQFNDDNAKSPYFVSPASDFAIKESPRGQHHDGMSRTSPLASLNRDGLEGQISSETRFKQQDRPNSWGRNASSLSTHTQDRSLFDDGSNRGPSAKKSRLNLLNPMSLLARRRSSQQGKLDENNISPLHVPAIPDFDPSIRGSIVHDFSAPRLRTPRREPEATFSQQQASDYGATQANSTSSPALHSPMLKNHLQDGGYTSPQLVQATYFQDQRPETAASHSLSTTAQDSPTKSLSETDPASDDTAMQRKNRDDEAPTPPPKATPPSSFMANDNAIPTFLPKHMKSTSSRFSFQMSGHGSTSQEQLLEDRHRERYPHEKDRPGVLDGEDNYDDYDFDADDGLEESIPGVNTAFQGYDADDDFGTGDVQVQDVNLQSSYQINTHNDYDFADEDEVDMIPTKDINAPKYGPPTDSVSGSNQQVQRLSLARFHFTPQSSVLSPTSTETGQDSEPTPRDSQGFPIGVADTHYSPSFLRSSHLDTDDEVRNQSQTFYDGLRISTGQAADQGLDLPSHADAFDDADLYFDDGEFADESVKSDSPFDETLLDDENHIRDIPAENAKRYEALMKQGASKGQPSVSNSQDIDKPVAFEVQSAPTTQSQTDTSHDQSGTKAAKSPSLTEDNLAAYHDALVMAANKAAASGRFDRQISFSDSSVVAEELPWSSSQSGHVSDASRYSGNVGTGMYPGDEPFPFDDENDFDDDLMIAEANAEALENDEDGFYGQEFGFYARAYGKEQPEPVNGGYFTSRGFNGVKRSHSGKVDFQEPSLTPITERSEWSARNSVVSLQFHTGVPNTGQSLPSPGLNQLMDSPLAEDEMSLSALIKLRRGAFGGSSTSINSLNDRNIPSSSPLAQVSGYKYAPSEALPNRLTASNQSLHTSASILESEEEDDEELTGKMSDRTQLTPRKPAKDIGPKTPEHTYQAKQIETPVTSRRMQHSRNSSGAESVSYVRDDDGRWILERRRTGDSGELEVIAREYLSAMRI